ncbi:2-oxo-4-hydroxy-4-carboxy-5-ureidoimidazoline decarboxylase-like [Wyeomyia smithii]|uniref:2-oxo-4-hydroxy-4-carboxy-5-ureidoimidazoline decarboxylase-like n=1 Tax=Wyeomyia smithii TaxID=174621 RepID=UPI00246815CF|nr:2-oxo-4-hydroxy-4-carboxy-5-ureidoimidazoline decarboxylase-like [Wyeomyia smithii]XP_055542101.1 2-oxo-4-hydroxy-4-carboxy-5-ureidoimidazoline decarboxylase-like [Wyeomyia smithii]
MKTKLSLEQLNALSPVEFHKTFENVVECWPEAAIFCSAMAPFRSFESMITVFENYLQRLSNENKLRILRLHPDLAGKLLDIQQLTEESRYEQSCVGLDKLTPADKKRLTKLNDEYKQRFGFPFVICVREASKFETIVNGVSGRIKNNPEAELNIAINEVKKICRLRILQLVNNL